MGKRVAQPLRGMIAQQPRHFQFRVGPFVRHMRGVRPAHLHIVERPETKIVVETEIGDDLFADREGAASRRGWRQDPLEPLAVRHGGREQRRRRIDGLMRRPGDVLGDPPHGVAVELGNKKSLHRRLIQRLDPHFARSVAANLYDIRVL